MNIQTTKGMLPEELLEKRVIPQQGTDEITDLVATEYWLDGEMVHRSLTGVLVGRDMGTVQQPLGA